MSKYGPGISAQQAFARDKERIKKALELQIVADEDENGFIYEPTTKEEADKFILSAFDNAVYHCLKAFASSRALEAMLDHYREADEVPPRYPQAFEDYKHFIAIEEKKDYKDRTYVYESEEEED